MPFVTSYALYLFLILFIFCYIFVYTSLFLCLFRRPVVISHADIGHIGMFWQAEFVRDLPMPKSIAREVSPPSNFYKEKSLDEDTREHIMKGFYHCVPSWVIKSRRDVILHDWRGPPYVPKYERVMRDLAIKPCVVKLNFVGEGQPGLIDLDPEERKWKCLLCPVEFLLAQGLHDHVPKVHFKFHMGFLEDHFPEFRRCIYCSKYLCLLFC